MGFVEKFSCYRIKHGSLGDSPKVNLFNKLFRNWCKGEKWGARECELTVTNLLCHTQNAVSNGEESKVLTLADDGLMCKTSRDIDCMLYMSQEAAKALRLSVTPIDAKTPGLSSI